MSTISDSQWTLLYRSKQLHDTRTRTKLLWSDSAADEMEYRYLSQIDNDDQVVLGELANQQTSLDTIRDIFEQFAKDEDILNGLSQESNDLFIKIEDLLEIINGHLSQIEQYHLEAISAVTAAQKSMREIASGACICQLRGVLQSDYTHDDAYEISEHLVENPNTYAMAQQDHTEPPAETSVPTIIIGNNSAPLSVRGIPRIVFLITLELVTGLASMYVSWTILRPLGPLGTMALIMIGFTMLYLGNYIYRLWKRSSDKDPSSNG